MGNPARPKTAWFASRRVCEPNISFFIASNVLILLLMAGDVQSRAAPTRSIVLDGHKVRYETLGDCGARPSILFLHGASGPDPYHKLASIFAERDYCVLLLHYFDATKAREPSPQNYATWVRAVAALANERRREQPSFRIGLLGVSFGASVALAAGSQNLGDAVVDWSGSLPDTFYEHLQGMPPLLILHGEKDPNVPVFNARQLIKLCSMRGFDCESHIYPAQGHGFLGSDLKDAEDQTVLFFNRHLH